jgi:hypothetical protein
MGVSRSLIRLLPILFLVNTVFGDASKAYPLQITVLSAELHPLNPGTPVPKDCDLQNFSAYCNESRNPTQQNVMRVREADGESFSIACTVDSRWSRCAPLPVGRTFEARKDKHGITVLYRDAKGKEKKQLFEVLAAAPASPSSTVTQTQPVAPQRTSPPPAQAAQPGATVEPQPEAPARTSPAPATPSAPTPAVLRGGAETEKETEKVRCNFTSTPPGAEIDLDGKYVGNTPSQIAVSTGTHVITFSMPGFGQWKRELSVLPGSELTVSAILQKD